MNIWGSPNTTAQTIVDAAATKAASDENRNTSAVTNHDKHAAMPMGHASA
jgi:hypothetical protein